MNEFSGGKKICFFFFLEACNSTWIVGTDRALAVGQWITDHVGAVGTSRATEFLRALGGYAGIIEQ
jgi:hypothetical protein